MNGDSDVPLFVELLVNYAEILECQEEIDITIIKNITNAGIIEYTVANLEIKEQKQWQACSVQTKPLRV